ncbi:MAG TPA: MBL fold metallo-hydrolase [Allosphingosinicella sp.]|jgi:hypothetical protein
MEFFTLEALPAQHGDCLILHYGSDGEPGTVLIDGGPSGTWRRSLEPRLKALSEARGDGFVIDLLMVSHIDDDHIVGIVDFTGAWLQAKEDGRPWPYPVSEFWHNSFERISNTDMTKVTASVLASTGGTGNLEDLQPDDESKIDAKDAYAAAKVLLASVAKGSRLRGDIKKLEIDKNTGFDGLVRPGVGEVPYKLGSELTLHIAGPLKDQLDALRNQFAKELPPASPLAAYVDESVPNLSSIVVLAAFKGKTMLLTGDARGDYVLDGLKQEKLLDAAGRIHVDILKLQHHGSVRNTEDEFYERVTADHYVVSADGRFGNPDRETFRLLIDARGKDAEYKIWVTYPVASLDAARKKEWEEDRARKTEKAKTKPKTKIPVAWDDARDSIATLIADRKAAGFAFQLMEPAPGRGAKIDLLDPIDF